MNGLIQRLCLSAKRRGISGVVLLCAGVFFFTTLATQGMCILNVRYVKADAVPGGDGMSWDGAYQSIQDAVDDLDDEGMEREVWVAQGTYTVSSGDQVLDLKEDIAVYGGFVGGETERAQRNVSFFQTIIDGEHQRRGVMAYYRNLSNEETVLDGFTIINGVATNGAGLYCDQGDPQIVNCTFINNRSTEMGGGIYVSWNTKPIITECTFSKNTAHSGGAIASEAESGIVVENSRFIGNNAAFGGAVRIEASVMSNSSMRFENCFFTKNSASTGGVVSAIGVAMPMIFPGGTAGARFENCTITGNTAYFAGSSSYRNEYGRCSYINCIVWDDTNYPEDVDAEYSCIQGGADGTGNIDSDPLLSPVDGRPLPASPCIDQGNNDVEVPQTDLNGVARVQNGQIDMGAYEYVPGSVAADVTVHLGPSEVMPFNPTFTIGSSSQLASGTRLSVYPQYYDIAFKKLGNWQAPQEETIIIPQAGLEQTYNYIHQPGMGIVFVDDDASEDGDGSSWENAFDTIQEAIDEATVQGGAEVWVAEGRYSDESLGTVVYLARDVHVYGGFAGNETSRAERDWNTHQTIIDGKRQFRGVYGSSDSTFDGFVITNCEHEYGAGMLNEYTNPTIANCVFISNKAEKGGGVYNYASQANVINCIFADNEAESGGAFFNEDSSLILTNSTLWKNQSVQGANGIVADASSVSIQNSVVWGSDQEIDADQIEVSHSCIQGGFDGVGNISDDPQLSHADFRPLETSPCIDAGSDEVANLPSMDYLGNERLQGMQVDMGAFEYIPGTESVEMTVTLGPQEVLEMTPWFQLSFGEELPSGSDVSLYPGVYPVQFRRFINWRVPEQDHVHVENDDFTINFEYIEQPGNHISFVDIDATGAGTGTSWEDAITSITSAAANVSENQFGEVWVAEGTYTSNSSSVIAVFDNVPVYGGFSGVETSRDQRDWLVNRTIIDGEGARRCVTVGSEATIDGFIITNGSSFESGGVDADSEANIVNCQFVNNSAGNKGGAIQVQSPLYIVNCDFSGNNSVEGGAVFVEYGNSVSFESCIFSENEAELGGAIYLENSIVDITNCEFNDNLASSGGALYRRSGEETYISNSTFTGNIVEESGGAIYNYGRDLYLTKCTFNGNTSVDGGALYCLLATEAMIWDCDFNRNVASLSGAGIYNQKSRIDITGCLFEDNNAGMDGGGVFCYQEAASNIEGCIFRNNYAESAGGAIDVSTSYTSTIVNCLFDSNYTINYGGAVFLYGGGNGSIINCTFVNNSSNSGGGICSTYKGGPVVNCILWGNSSGIVQNPEYPMVVNYSCVQEGFEGDGNMDVDPLLVDYGSGDYRLAAGSPCLNTGTLEDAPNFDIRGVLRPQGSGIDMGAYEYHEAIDQGTGANLAILDLSDGWLFTRPNPYEDIEGQYIPQDRKWDISFTGNSNSFGFVESPLISIVDTEQKSIYSDSLTGPTGSNSLYCSTLFVASNLQDLTSVPVIRHRASCESFQRSDMVVATSEDNGNFSPGMDGRKYQNYFTVPEGEDQIRMDLDVLNFNPNDASDGIVSMQYADVQYLGDVDSLTGETVVMSKNLLYSTIGWIPAWERTEQLAAPKYFSDVDGLLIRGIFPDTDSSEYPVAIFGYWNYEVTDNPLHEALYRIRWTVGSDIQSGSENTLPTFRLRMNDSSLKFASVVNIDSALPQGQELPSAGNPVTYDSWFQIPSETVGNDWELSFDYLYVNKAGYAPEDDPTAALILEAVEVIRYDIP